MYTQFTTLAQALDTHRVDQLKDLAALVCKPVPSRKAELVAEISKAVLSGYKEVFAKLPETGKLAVAVAVHEGGGSFDSTRFAARARHLDREPMKALPWRSCPHLYLFFYDNTIPADILGKLKEFVPKPEGDALRYLSSVPETVKMEKSGWWPEGEAEVLVRDTSAAALANLETLLRLVERGSLKVSAKTGKPAAATMTMIGGMLRDGDWYGDDADEDGDAIGPIQAFSWPLLLLGGGLASTDSDKLRLTRQGQNVLRQGDFAGGIRGIWKKWLKTTVIDEFSRVDAIKGQKSASGRAMAAVVNRRPMIREALTHLAPDRWVSIDELARFMVSEDLTFKVANNTWKLYIGEAGYGNLGDSDSWPLLELRYLLVFLFEYAATLGLVDVGYIFPHGARPDFTRCWGADDLDFLSRCDGLLFIRLNALGAFVLDLADTFMSRQDARQAKLTVHEDGVMKVAEGERLYPIDALFLDGIAERVGKESWRLTRDSLLRAIDAGRELDVISSYLEKAVASGIPETVAFLIDDIRKRVAAFVPAGMAMLFECRNPQLVEMVRADAKLAKVCLPAGATHLVVLPGKEKQFAAAMERLGFRVPLGTV